MMGKIVVVGKNSFLAKLFVATNDCVAVSHDEIDRAGLFDGAAAVINFAFDPHLRAQPYDESHDVDRAVAARIQKSTRYVMLSTRMVYGSDVARGATELAAADGLNAYGRSKLRIEAQLGERLGDRLTVLRIANPLGWDRTSGYTSFILQVLGRLKDKGQIMYDVSPFVRRDFVTDDYLVRALATACETSPGGTFNLGSGIPLEIGRVAMWVLEGFGRGELLLTSASERDEFWLDMTRSASVFGAPPSYDELRAKCIELGRRIAQ